MVKLIKESSDKRWLNVELTSDEYKKLKKFLVDNNIKHEASGAYNLIHVEVYVDEYERKKIDEFLSTLDEGCTKKKKKRSSGKRTSMKEYAQTRSPYRDPRYLSDMIGISEDELYQMVADFIGKADPGDISGYDIEKFAKAKYDDRIKADIKKHNINQWY